MCALLTEEWAWVFLSVQPQLSHHHPQVSLILLTNYTSMVPELLSSCPGVSELLAHPIIASASPWAQTGLSAARAGWSSHCPAGTPTPWK